MSFAGLSIEYCFVRRGSIHGEEFSTLTLYFRNEGDSAIAGIKVLFASLLLACFVFASLLLSSVLFSSRITHQPLPQVARANDAIREFPEINSLPAGTSSDAVMSVRFAGMSVPVKFAVATRFVCVCVYVCVCVCVCMYVCMYVGSFVPLECFAATTSLA